MSAVTIQNWSMVSYSLIQSHIPTMIQRTFMFQVNFVSGSGRVYPSVTLTSISGALFTLESVDIGEVVDSLSASEVEIIGTLNDGSTVSTTVILDGITDGIGIAVDFQTISFDASWTGLASVSFQAVNSSGVGTLGFDNLQLVEEAILFTDHSYVLDNLTPETPYFAQIIAYDSAGNASDPVGLTFTTLAAGVLTPPVISNTNIIAGVTTAAVSWTTDEPATSSLDYGVTDQYELGTVDNGSVLSTSHSLNLTGLSSSTLYYVQLTSTDGDGNSAVVGDLTFTTDASGDTIPPLISNEAVDAQEVTATLTWLTDEASTAEISYGLTNTYELGTLLESASSNVHG